VTRRIAAATRIYSAMLRCYPPAFYRDFGGSMIEDFAEASRDLARDIGAAALYAQWARAVFDLGTSIPRQWLRHPALWIVPAAAVGPALCLQALAILAANIPLLDVRAQTGREDEALLALIMTTACFPVVAVIVFAWWFLAPALRGARRPRRRRA
jgi:hypothetical protein